MTDVIFLLENNGTHVLKLPPKTTDRIQPMDLSVSKSIEEFLKKVFDDWYSGI